MYPRRPTCSALRSLPSGRHAGKGSAVRPRAVPQTQKRVHRHNGHRADNTHTLRSVRHDTQSHAVTHVSQQHAVRTHKHADARVTARTVQCLLKRCCCGRVARSVCPLAPRRPSSGRLLDVPALRLSFRTSWRQSSLPSPMAQRPTVPPSLSSTISFPVFLLHGRELAIPSAMVGLQRDGHDIACVTQRLSHQGQTRRCRITHCCWGCT